jgi:hypothetical protein
MNRFVVEIAGGQGITITNQHTEEVPYAGHTDVSDWESQ